MYIYVLLVCVPEQKPMRASLMEVIEKIGISRAGASFKQLWPTPFGKTKRKKSLVFWGKKHFYEIKEGNMF